MSGGYVLSKNDYPLNSNIRDIETDSHGKEVIGPGLLLEKENKGNFLYFHFKMIQFLLILSELRMVFMLMAI